MPCLHSNEEEGVTTATEVDCDLNGNGSFFFSMVQRCVKDTNEYIQMCQHTKT